jgi:hypothetical protein
LISVSLYYIMLIMMYHVVACCCFLQISTHLVTVSVTQLVPASKILFLSSIKA